MEGFRYEVAAIWKEVRWTFYFLVLLLPACLIATALAALGQGTPTPSPALLLAFGVPMALVALIGAGLWDGVMGQLGRYVWWPLLLWFGLLLIRTYLRQEAAKAQDVLPCAIQEGNDRGRNMASRRSRAGTAGRKKSRHSRLSERLGAGRVVAAWLRDSRISWRELRRLKDQVIYDSADPRVRELRLLIEP